MWQQTQCFCLVLSGIITGSLSVSWTMKVSPVVSVPRGEDAVLSCSFTHPDQQDYSGMITVKWLARESSAEPFFICSVKNDSVHGPDECSDSGLKYSLEGDPRRGDLSLLISRVQLTDNGTYFCRVEVDARGRSYQKETQLYVTVKPQILSLSVVETSPGSDSATRRLVCKVEGHPLPAVTWLSASGSPLEDQVQTLTENPYRLNSSVPYLQEDVLTCRAENRLGRAEQRYPASKTLMITLIVCGLAALLLLLSTWIICYLRNKARANDSAIYENADVVENHQQQVSASPAEGDVELQPVYSAVILTSSTSSQHASLKSSTRHAEESDVFYSTVNVH